MSKNVVTRFAPSPTGFMHIGGVRTALFAYLWARKNKGTFILRIEDTDKAREIAGSIAHIQESLRWLGMDWDFGPDNPGQYNSCIQSERLEIYTAAAHKLIAQGHAYPDPYSKDELESFRIKAQEEKRPFLFREHRPQEFDSWDEKTPLRFKVPVIKRYLWHDEVRGKLEAGEEMLDDFILVKGDGYPTYNFAHIIDDLEMDVTHIMRADEFISSMPKFLSLYDALDIQYPKFVTLPPILRDDRTKKLGKRDGAKDILEYRDEGLLPEAMMNFLALTGWNPGTEQEYFTKEELIQTFDISKIQRAGAAFNEEKLHWLNKEHLANVDDETYKNEVLKRLPTDMSQNTNFIERLPRLLPSIRERLHVYADAMVAAEAGEYNYVYLSPEIDLDMLKWKKDDSYADSLPRLQKAINLLSDANFESPDTIKQALWGYAEEVGRGELLWPLRVALTGLERSPDPFTCAYILGKEETLSRVQNVCDKIMT